MEMIGEPLNEQQVEQLLAIADLDQDGRINYEGKLHTNTQSRTNAAPTKAGSDVGKREASVDRFLC